MTEHVKPKVKTVVLVIILLIVGVFIAIYPTLFPSEQCPNSYTQAQVDASGCIVGADIGGGILQIFGTLIIIVSGVMLSYITGKHILKK